MKKIKALLSVLLAVMLLAGLSLSAFAVEDPKVGTQPLPRYLSAAGTVISVSPRFDVDGAEIPDSYLVTLEDAEGETVNFVVTGDTYMITYGELEPGAKVIGYYPSDMPVILIYPPQYTAAVMVVNLPERQSVKVDRFDDELLSEDAELKLNISDDTEIITTDGAVFEGEIKGRDLIVLYTTATFSIPAQTTPKKIIVLAEREEPLPETDETFIDASELEIIVEGEKIDAPKAYYNEEGILMVPLRAIAEALGYEVTWDNDSKGVMLDYTISFQIGVDSYNFARMAPIELGTAPELTDGRTYVPLSFFRLVAGMNNAYAFEGQIVIDNGEIMY